MKRLLTAAVALALGSGAFVNGRAKGTVHLPPPPPHLPTAPADEDDVRWAARAELDLPERQDVALRVLGFLGHPDDAELLWRYSLEDGHLGAVATSLLGRVSQNDPALRDRLVTLATDPESMHREAAVEALGDLGGIGLERLAVLGSVKGVLRGLFRSRGESAAAQMATHSAWGEHRWLVERDPRSVGVLKGEDQLVAIALHNPSEGRLRLEDRLANRVLDETTRRMIQALPPYEPWLDHILTLDAPLADRGEILLHFDRAYEQRLLDQLVPPDPKAAYLLHGPTVETLRQAEEAADGKTMQKILQAEWKPGQVPDALVEAVLESETLRTDWLHIPDFLSVAGTPAAVDALFDGASRSRFGIGWMDPIGRLPDPTGPTLLWAIAEADTPPSVRTDALKELMERGPDQVPRVLDALRADLGRVPDYSGNTVALLLQRGTEADVEDVLTVLCLDGTRHECETLLGHAERWSVIRRLEALADEADDATRTFILANAIERGHLDDRLDTWIGDEDPAVASAALARLPEVAGDDLVPRLIAALPDLEPQDQLTVGRFLVDQDVEVAAAAVRALADPSQILDAFSGRQDTVSRALRREFAADPRPDVRSAALAGMILGSRDEEDLCRSALADEAPEVRRAAANCVAYPETTYAAEALADAYRLHGHPEILEALKRVGGPLAERF